MSLSAKSAYFWRSALQGMRRAPFIHFIAVLTLALALFSVGMTRAGARFVEGLLTRLDQEAMVTVYLQDGLGEPDVEGLAAEAARVFHAPVKRVSPKEALERLARELPEGAEALNDVRDNPLPQSLELKVPRARQALPRLREAADKVKGLPGVVAVDYSQEALERLSSLSRLFGLAVAMALGLVSLATVVIVSATLQLAIYARREELEIQKLVGATNRFVKAPFLIEGLLQGLLGALVASLALGAFFLLAAPHFMEALAFLQLERGAGPSVTPELILELFGLGAGLGLLGSFVAVGRFLRV
jgi:cell division transport system permease protein